MFSERVSFAGGSVCKAKFESGVLCSWERRTAEASKVHLKEMKALLAKKKVDICAVPPGFIPVRNFLTHRTLFLGKVREDVKWFERFEHISLLKWYST